MRTLPIAAEFEDFKAKLGKDEELPKLNQEKIKAEIEPAIVDAGGHHVPDLVAPSGSIGHPRSRL